MPNTVGPTSTELSPAKRALMARRLKGFATLEEDHDQIKQTENVDRAPISVDQYRIWLHASMHPDVPTYNEPVTVCYHGALDVPALSRSLNYFIRRHDALRAYFAVHDDEVFQFVAPEVTVELKLIDLTSLSEQMRQQEARRYAYQQALRPIEMDKAPLFRAIVLKMAEDEFRLDMVLHHVIFDGLSIQETLIPELDVIYRAVLAGEEPSLPRRMFQYRDYSAWRQQQLNSPAMQKHIDYWRHELAGELPVLRLPLDRPRPPMISQRGSIETFTVSKELTDALHTLGNQNGSTLYMTMLSVFMVLLFRYGQQEDIIVGGGSDARRRPELRGMMGYILDTFAVRTHPNAEMSFKDFLREAKHAILGALSAAEAPFDRVVQALGTKRNPSHHPIFETFFSFLAPGGGLPDGWEVLPKQVNGGAAKFDLYVEVEEMPSSTAVCIIYNSDLFDGATIQRLFGHWTTLLQAVCDRPETALGQLPLLTGPEQDLILTEWNQTTRAVPETTIHELVSAQVLRTPNEVAVEFKDRKWSYAELEAKANQLAGRFKKAGAEPGTLVAICIDRSDWMLAALLGILKTGATYLPLDPGTPLSRITMCLEDATPAVLLTQRSMVANLPALSGTVLVIEDVIDALVDTTDVAMDLPKVHPDDSAYVIHTSGSTGRPKAVELQHRAVVNLLLSMQREPGITASDTLVSVTTISFDIAVLELFLPIITGARVVIASREEALDPYKLSDLMDRVKCTVMQATPATWRALIAMDWPGKPGMKILCGGEALTRDFAQKLLSRKLDLWNVYGPTETTIWSTTSRVQNRVGTVSIGRPIANTTTYILDTRQQPVPIGIPGELYIGGMGLAKGYRGAPELTAQKFVWPAVANGERIYNTGDYAVYRPDGTIECQGRADNQVKIRGHRIELEEVELHLNAHAQIAAAAARVWDDRTGGFRLSGYLVGKNGPAPDVATMRAFLQGRLPEYMIPSDFVTLDALPLTPNGKTNRKALPEPTERVVSAAEPKDELTPDEVKLARIWAEALGVKDIRRSDNFFDLGGHSLLLVVLFSRINKEFSANLPITTIFDAQTLSELSKVLKEKVRISSLVPVQTGGTKPPLFMAHSYLLYHGLSSALGADQPFYGLRELERDGDLSIEERARQYVADMRRVQPHGPYRVSGWCAAGPLAVEISRQILIQGEQVSSLLLFDAWLPDYVEELQRAEKGLSRIRSLRNKWRRFDAKSKHQSFREKLGYVINIGRYRARQLRDDFYIRHWAEMNRLSKRFNVPLPQFMHNTTLQTFAAMREFQADLLPVKITLVRALDSHALTNSVETCGWERVAEKGVDVLWAPGDHETMFRGTNLMVTGKLVRKALDPAIVSQQPAL